MHPRDADAASRPRPTAPCRTARGRRRRVLAAERRAVELL